MISAPVSCPQFVGRQRELTFLIERRRDLAHTHGGIVLVGGEAGIGKSRLVREFLDRTGKSRGAPDLLAYHWWAAGDRIKALEYGERGGDAAHAVHAYADAIACYARTLSLLDPNGPDAARMHYKVGLNCGMSAFAERAQRELQAAWAFCQTVTDDAPFIIQVAHALAVATFNDGRPRESITILRRAVDVVDRCGDARVSERARLLLASYLVDLGFIDETLALLRFVSADVIDKDASMSLLFWPTTARVCELQGDAAGIRAVADNIFGVRDEGVPPGTVIEAFTEVARAALSIGEAALARRCRGVAMERCRKLKSTPYHGSFLIDSAMERVLAGDFTEAYALVVAALPMIGEFKTDRHAAVLAALAVGIVRDDPELLAHEPDAAFIDEVFATHRPSSYGPLAAVCAQLWAARGEHDAARRLLRRAIDAATEALPLTGSFPLVVVAAQLCDRGDSGAVMALCAGSIGSGPASKAAAELAEALLIARFGDADSAIDMARSAASGFDTIGWPVYEALAFEAAGDLDGARRIFARIGDPRGTIPSAEPTGGSREEFLTPRELEIATQVASGCTNREIAGSLNVSVSLIEKYLTTIYGKLAIRSRSGLTAYILAREVDRHRSAG